jgi:hypothetical protein
MAGLSPLRGVQACVFDAYGTLFDFAAAARTVLGDDTRFITLWRDKQLQYTWLRAAQGATCRFLQVTGDAAGRVGAIVQGREHHCKAERLAFAKTAIATSRLLIREAELARPQRRFVRIGSNSRRLADNVRSHGGGLLVRFSVRLSSVCFHLEVLSRVNGARNAICHEFFRGSVSYRPELNKN